jgi:lysophospholipase L1-like esterase
MRRTAAVICLLVGISACGEDETRVAALGDSITAGTPGWDPRPEVRAGLAGPDERSQYAYWAERHLPETDFRNCGVPGERTDEIRRRLEDCADGADVLIVQGGVNDIAQGRGTARAAADLGAMVRRGKALGLRVAIVELLPWNDAPPRARRAIRRLNRSIRALARRERVKLIRWYRVVEDPRVPGRMRPRLTADGAHPSVAGYRLLGEAVELP